MHVTSGPGHRHAMHVEVVRGSGSAVCRQGRQQRAGRGSAMHGSSELPHPFAMHGGAGCCRNGAYAIHGGLASLTTQGCVSKSSSGRCILRGICHCGRGSTPTQFTLGRLSISGLSSPRIACSTACLGSECRMSVCQSVFCSLPPSLSPKHVPGPGTRGSPTSRDSAAQAGSLLSLNEKCPPSPVLLPFALPHSSRGVVPVVWDTLSQSGQRGHS